MRTATAIHAEGAPAGPPVASAVGPGMGGRVGVHIRPAPGTSVSVARSLAVRVHRRILAWAGRLTRFSDVSDLAHLNADRAAITFIRPTLAAVLRWGSRAASMTDGLVDITLLDARLMAEFGPSDVVADPTTGPRVWRIDSSRRGAVLSRPTAVRFDLDGVAKGWLADRALVLLKEQPAAVVDADGDIAISVRAGETWQIGVSNPIDASSPFALEVSGLDAAGPQRFGVATSGTSIHRWAGIDTPRHHLIDPRTGRPAVTDLVQATVLAGSAAEAEAFAKAMVIVGSELGLRLLDRREPRGAILFTERGEVLATPTILRWLA